MTDKNKTSTLGFGQSFAGHMFLMDYKEGKGWHHPRTVPYGPLSLDPAAKVFHYGQSVFEGMKICKAADGRLLLFRPQMHADRINRSLIRMAMPPMDPDLFIESIRALADLERETVPDEDGAYLYVRPFVIATEAGLGVRAAKEYLFVVIMSAAGRYFETETPLKLLVEHEQARAVPGGTGSVKFAGNYAASLQAQQRAEQIGCDQVLWLDANGHQRIEEAGSMNVFFVINGRVCTPEPHDSVLSGVTRDSVMQLLRDRGIECTERTVSLDEIIQAHRAGRLEEMFGTGTAAAIVPIGQIRVREEWLTVGDGSPGRLAMELKQEIIGIQTGIVQDRHGWTVRC